MRSLLFVLSLALVCGASAQRCGGSHRILIRTPEEAHTGGKLNYSIGEVTEHTRTSLDSVPGDRHAMLLTTRSGCGMPEIHHSVRHAHTGQTMPIAVYNLPGDIPGIDLHIPFTSGIHTHFDLHAIARCATGKSAGDTIACHAGFGVLYDRHTFEPLDLLPWQMPPNIQPYFEAREAGFHGGGEAFRSMAATHFDRALIEHLGVSVTLSGQVMVETDNTVHQVRMDRIGQPELEAEMTRVLQILRAWRCAVMERPSDAEHPPSFTPFRAAMPFTYTISPDSIWLPISDEVMEVSPKNPSPRDSIAITFHWLGGSCGHYRGSARRERKRTDEPFTTLLVDFNGPLGEICTDIAQQSFTFRTAPLPPGRYRIRMELPDGVPTSPVGLDRFAVRDFEVR